MRNSSLQDVSRMEYLHGNIGGVLDAIRYIVVSFFCVDNHNNQKKFFITTRNF